MSFSKVFSAQSFLLKARIIDVEVDLSKGLYSFSVVGLPDKAVEESRDRIGAAIRNCGFTSPKHKNQKVVISLAPADLKKEGPSFDLAMALGYLLAADEIQFNPKDKLFLGELSLDGKVRNIRGVLPLVIEAKHRKFKEVYVPSENVTEAAIISGIKIFGVATLAEVVEHLDEKVKSLEEEGEGRAAAEEPPPEPPPVRLKLKPAPVTKIDYERASYEIDFTDIKGQEGAKRGLEIAAAGGHNVMMFGPPGTGKTMLAKAFAGLLPPLSFKDMLEATSIHSVAGILGEASLIIHPPYRSPHHTSSYPSLIGGGSIPKPGEVTLAHHGVLFMDEFPEFNRQVIDALREPLEEKVVSISRAKSSAAFPANFILVAAMNPCPCGNRGSKTKECICRQINLQHYQRKISGPIVDRIDLWLEVSEVDYKKLGTKGGGEETIEIKKRVLRARTLQKERFRKNRLTISTNSAIKPKDILNLIVLKDEVRKILDQSAYKLDISARAYHRLIKLARTIADLDDSCEVESQHILEALQYRPKRINN